MVGKKVNETCEEHKERQRDYQRAYRARQPSFFERIEANVGDAMFSSRVLVPWIRLRARNGLP
jgi:hypothetical protein